MPTDETGIQGDPDLPRLLAERRAKLARLRASGEAFPNDFRPDAKAADLCREHAGHTRERLAAAPIEVRVAGRIMLRRAMGKASFITLEDSSGRIQCYMRRDDLGVPAYDACKELWDLGDVVGIIGTLMKTNTGELTVHASSARLLSKAIRPPPEKYRGLVDVEARYRRRYLDLMSNEATRRTFTTRSHIIQAIREWLLRHEFLEVETPMLHPIPGGAAARPFVTHHNALDLDLYLRIAPELYLKRLVVGGFERVFEINRNFRNEGLSVRHNPEFTMLEFYQAYADYLDFMDLTEQLLATVAQQTLGTTEFMYQGTGVSLMPPYERLPMLTALARTIGCSEEQLTDPIYVENRLRAQGIAKKPEWGVGKLQLELFEQVVESQLDGPVFITQYPAEVSPLSRRNADNPQFVDRFELFIGGMEIANGFSEINDPDDQAERFRMQVEAGQAGDQEAMRYDADYIEALEHGMPPTAGEGIGIDRLTMLLTDSPAIRNVILFPHLRPKGVTAAE